MKWRSFSFTRGERNWNSILSNESVQQALRSHLGWWNVVINTERFCVLVNKDDPDMMEIWVREDLLQ